MDTSEKQIKRIVLNRMERCAVCHHSFSPDDIHVLSRRKDMWMMVVQCDECQARNFVAAVLGDGDPDEAQLALRRMSEEHVLEGVAPGIEASGPPIAATDVVDMHLFLREFDGDFQRLFRSTPPPGAN